VKGLLSTVSPCIHLSQSVVICECVYTIWCICALYSYFYFAWLWRCDTFPNAKKRLH